MSSNHNCCYHRSSGMPQPSAAPHHCAETGRSAPCAPQPQTRPSCSCGSHPTEHRPQGIQDTERKMPRIPKNHMFGNTSHQTSCREKEFPIAMAYVPWQKFRDVYHPEKAFCQATIFAELDLPFYGYRKGGFR